MKNTTELHASASLALTDLLEHADWLHQVALSLVRDGHEAEDLSQDALLRASRSPVPAGVAPRAWLGGIVRNLVRDRRRQGARRKERELRAEADRGRDAAEAGSTPMAGEVELLARQRELLGHIEALPEEQRSAIIARFYDGLPPRKIAQRDGVPVSTIHSRLQRGMETLRRALQAEYGEGRAWALWILPLAQRGGRAKAPVAAVGSAMAIAAVLVGGAAFALRSPGAPPSPSQDLAQGDPSKSESVEEDLIAPATIQSRERVPTTTKDSVQGEVPAPAPRHLHVRVLDRDGRPVTSPVPVGANSRVVMPPEQGRRSADYRGYESADSADGVATFGNPWEHTRFANLAVTAAEWEKFSLHRVYIDGPGLAEFEPDASQAVSFHPLRADGPAAEHCSLTVPPMGKVRLMVRGVDGGECNESGTATIRFPGVGQYPGGRERDYQAPIKDGHAEWPHFALGARPFELTIDLKSVGASWVTEGIGPKREGETAVVRSRRPDRPAVTARLVDSEGQPLAVERVYLKFEGPDTQPFGGPSILSQSTADGWLRFELTPPEDEGTPLPAFVLHGYRSVLVPRGETQHLDVDDALSSVFHPPGTYASGVDLGDVPLRFERRSEIRGVAVNASGEPLEQIRITVHTPRAGAMGSQPTGPDGSFSFTAPVREDTTLSARSLNGEYGETKIALPRESVAPNQPPLRIVMSKGASIRGQIQLDGFQVPSTGLQIVLTDDLSHEEAMRLYVQPDGSFRRVHVPPGSYYANLLDQGGSVIDTIPGVQVLPDKEHSFEKLNRLSLADYYRKVRVTWEGVPERWYPTALVHRHHPAPGITFALVDRLDDGLTLPKGVDAYVTFQANERQLRIEDISTIGEELHLDFREGFVVVLLIGDAPLATSQYSLKGAPGTPTADVWRSLDESDLKSGRVEVKLPVAGQYQLVKCKKARPVTGSEPTDVHPGVPIGLPLHVFETSENLPPQEIRVTLRD